MTATATQNQIVTLRVSAANGAQWGEDSAAEDVPTAAANVAALAEVYIRRKHGGSIPVHVEITQDYVGSILYGSPKEIVEPASAYIWEHWTDPALWKEGFDAEEFYLAHLPAY